ncbi:unnamed protein product [Onchocerca flexuosa]|uniref:Synaptobrevin n=1 Tax=Onchocerca flexuosa TaxID=387005 RepID=A0A183HA99_9BILA|nr:unnamed protein product [Onchocerca flexuosa]
MAWTLLVSREQPAGVSHLCLRILFKKGRSQSLMMFNEELKLQTYKWLSKRYFPKLVFKLIAACDHSPTGYITTNPEDLFSRRYRRGNSESVRHLSVRVRVAEEEVKKYRLQNEDLKKTVAKMTKELCDKQYEMESLRKTFEQQVDGLQHQLSKKEREDKQSKFEAIMSLLQGNAGPPKIYEPPFSFLDEPKPETVNVEAQTDDWMLRSIQKSVNAAVAGPSVISKCNADNESNDAEKCGKMAEEIAKLENEKFFLTTQLKLTRNKIVGFFLDNLEIVADQQFIIDEE